MCIFDIPILKQIFPYLLRYILELELRREPGTQSRCVARQGRHRTHSSVIASNVQNVRKGKVLLKESVQQEWVSYPDAERYSGLSHTTLWRYVTSGELKAARIGRSVRIHLPSLREFMERASES